MQNGFDFHSFLAVRISIRGDLSEEDSIILCKSGKVKYQCNRVKIVQNYRKTEEKKMKNDECRGLQKRFRSNLRNIPQKKFVKSEKYIDFASFFFILWYNIDGYYKRHGLYCICTCPNDAYMVYSGGVISSIKCDKR